MSDFFFFSLIQDSLHCKVAGNSDAQPGKKVKVWWWNSGFWMVIQFDFIGLEQVAEWQEWEVQMVKWQGGVMTNQYKLTLNIVI